MQLGLRACLSGAAAADEYSAFMFRKSVSSQGPQDVDEASFTREMYIHPVREWACRSYYNTLSRVGRFKQNLVGILIRADVGHQWLRITYAHTCGTSDPLNIGVISSDLARVLLWQKLLGD
jgi:hypothetical protein